MYLMQLKLIFMITSQQFDEALKTISDYKFQLETRLVQSAPKVVIVDIQNKINKHIFFNLQSYFSDYLKLELEWENLKAMELETLKTIDFNKLRRYRGFGLMAEERLKNTINTFSINSDISI